ncbi:tubulin polyglutamylase TTLL6 [Cimex lectularius]|uniref:Uncharacterized protein n=1 Tax=Cimex lectularius TaxID=79782 RepID=A0A8I6RNC1_CIMLE|nr:tubulin polyglutamylase TTLL6 [Cimex lectularius]
MRTCYVLSAIYVCWSRKMIIQKKWGSFKTLCIFVLCFCLGLVLLNLSHLKCVKQENTNRFESHLRAPKPAVDSPIYVVYGKRVDTGHLRHVFDMFKLFGYERRDLNASKWDVMWAHDYPFQKLYSSVKNLKPHQKINHFPGSGFITNKMDLATTGLTFIPKAFKIPQQKEQLLQYAKTHTLKKFVQKSNDHRGIKIKKFDEINFTQNDSFVQEFIDNPLLVDGYKFDIGVYTIITSFDPLRVYIYNGDALFRYCPEKYYPFDDKHLDKYVVGDNYLPTWEVPSLRKLYKDMGYSMKQSFNGYMKLTGRDPSIIWQKIEEAIKEICLNKEPQVLKYLSLYKSKRNFFEMVRFDFVVDNDLNVFVMEVNMSPNLSSAHFLENQILYEQVLYNLFHLLNFGNNGFLKKRNIQVSDKNIVVNPEVCSGCSECMAPECELCLQCLNSESKAIIKDAYLEHTNKHDCKRIFPSNVDDEMLYDGTLSPENRFMVKWFKAKCSEDKSWC